MRNSTMPFSKEFLSLCEHLGSSPSTLEAHLGRYDDISSDEHRSFVWFRHSQASFRIINGCVDHLAVPLADAYGHEYAGPTEHYEFGGVKLGMTKGDVLNAWGHPDGGMSDLAWSCRKVITATGALVVYGVRYHEDVAGVVRVYNFYADLDANQPSSQFSATKLQPRSARDIRLALEDFMECVRYLNTRRSETSLLLTSEAAVQDALFLTLRLWVPDLVPETPTDRVASRYTIKDFRSVAARTVVEVKFVRDRDHGRAISREMHDDIETYRSDQLCDHLIFFVYDPDVHIPDRGALQRQIEVERQYDGRKLHCHLVLRP